MEFVTPQRLICKQANHVAGLVEVLYFCWPSFPVRSIRIDDFSMMTPLAPVIVLCRRPVESEFVIQTTTCDSGQQNFQ